MIFPYLILILIGISQIVYARVDTGFQKRGTGMGNCKLLKKCNICTHIRHILCSSGVPQNGGGGGVFTPAPTPPSPGSAPHMVNRYTVNTQLHSLFMHLKYTIVFEMTRSEYCYTVQEYLQTQYSPLITSGGSSSWFFTAPSFITMRQDPWQLVTMKMKMILSS